ncbi:MAG: hypothetical protein LQ345_000788 [Seirophora villosa]|nr:MAG: hypothetical protein LQ345_000788 [Seirophora villosa]
MIQAPIPPPPPPHPHHQGASSRVQSLPVDFEHLPVAPMPPHLGQPRMSPPLMGGFGGLGQEFDTSLLRKEKDSYEGYNFERVNPQHPREKATWALVTKTKMPLGQSELLAMVNKQKRKGPTAWQLLKSEEMKGFKRKQVDELIEERKRADPRFSFDLVGLKLDQYTNRQRGVRGTSAFQVILRRHVRKDLTSAGPAGLANLHEPHREVVDLTGGSEDPSEGSSRGFYGAGSSPPPHIRQTPQHGFPDRHGPVHPPPPPPFVYHPGPPTREVRHEDHHHDVHRASPSPPHMPHFEGPFIHQDPHQAERPPPFVPHMHPQAPPHDRNDERYRDAKGGKHKKDSKGWKAPKPEIHQSKPHKSERKHKRVPSEPDWDYFSESSDSSQAYTDLTPDTVPSTNSSRNDKKGYYKGKDSRRDSHSHHDDRDEQVYRVHRRKPTISPDRSRPSGRSRYEVEDVELIPATHLRNARPYLTRSRTSGQRQDRWPQQSDRSAFHTRHMSYDDERHHSPRGLTPPSRRGSVYAPKRATALDLYDAHEQQEGFEREEIKRELLREKHRKDELRESVARQLEREAEEMRRPLARERLISSDALYDERPGRYSRGYDNDRFVY